MPRRGVFGPARAKDWRRRFYIAAALPLVRMIAEEAGGAAPLAMGFIIQSQSNTQDFGLAADAVRYCDGGGWGR
jgi:hypothetical protein